jgi:hypothetical protein
VAQLIARSVWDREVEGLSPFTPTKKKPVHLDRFFLVRADGLKPSTRQLQLTQVEGLAKRSAKKKAPKVFSF